MHFRYLNIYIHTNRQIDIHIHTTARVHIYRHIISIIIQPGTSISKIVNRSFGQLLDLVYRDLIYVEVMLINHTKVNLLNGI